ncbi:MAG: DsbA family protein [Candidatus Jorgensenbacteria bacterium]
MEEKKKRDFLLPASILAAALLISISMVYSAGKKENAGTASLTDGEQAIQSQNPSQLIRPLSKDDHVRGVSDSAVIVVEYSDLECPYCKDFHNTMQQVLSEYDGKMALAYRHFPLDSIHSKARKEAEASECAAELGGNETFWAYIDRIFEITPSNNGLDLTLLPNVAEYVGLNSNEFRSCLDSGKMAESINEDMEDVTKLNAWSQQNTGRSIGTPYSVVVNNKTGESTVIPGALPLEQIKLVIDQVLEE